jgi:serine/threonine protein kinase
MPERQLIKIQTIFLLIPRQVSQFIMQVRDSYMVCSGYSIATCLVLQNECAVLVPWTLVSLPNSLRVPRSSAAKKSSALHRLENREYANLQLIAFKFRRPGIRMKVGSKSFDFIVTPPCTSFLLSLFDLSKMQRVDRIPKDTYMRINGTSTMNPQSVYFFNPRLERAITCLHNSKAGTFPLCPTVWNTIELTCWKGTILGEGGFGIAQLASSTKGGPVHVLKTLKSNQLCFEDYWKNIIAESLAPESLVQIHSSTRASICMPLECTKTLFTMMQKHIPLAIQFSFLRNILYDLHVLHRRGMSHCDLKAANIVCDLRGKARVIDYGSSSLYEGPTRTTKCTFDTRAPEVLRQEITWLCGDIWSFGVIALQLSTGNKLVEFISGQWTDGTKWKWDMEETEICLKQISKVNTAESMGVFLRSVKADAVSLGMAVLLSQCLQTDPGERDSLGLCQYFQPLSMFHWPFPHAAIATFSSPVAETSMYYTEETESYLGIHTLDGSIYSNSSEVPQARGRSKAIRAEREEQLRYIVLLLEQLDILTPKLFILTLDFLDRLDRADASTFAHRLWENACVVLASMVADYYNVTCQKVCEAAYALVSSPMNEKLLQGTVVKALGSLQFKLLREDNIWEISGARTSDQAYLNGLLHGYTTWPDSHTNVWDFLDSITKTTSLPSWFSCTFKKPMQVLSDAWNTKKVQEQVLTPLSGEFQPSTPSSTELNAYLANFLSKRVHPMFMALPPCVKSMNITEVQNSVQLYVNECCKHVTDRMIKMEDCVSCGKESSYICRDCKSWSICEECNYTYGLCPQCIKDEEKIKLWNARH